MIVTPTVWLAQVIDTCTKRVRQTVCVHNDILNSGRRDAMSMLVGVKSPGVYKWVEFGSSDAAIDPTQTGCVAPLPSTGTPYRAAGEWSQNGSDFTMNLAVPGTTIEGTILEAALFPSQQPNLGPALLRVVFPTALSLTVSNTLTLSIFLTP